MDKKLVVFDLDGTLVDADCAQDWLLFLKQKEVSGIEQAIVNCDKHMDLYEVGNMDMTLYMADWLKPLLGMSKQELADLAKEFSQDWIMPKLFRQVNDLITEYKQQEAQLVIVSASPDFLVQAVAEHLAIPHAIGIETVFENGALTDKTHEPYSFKKGKVWALQAWWQQQQQNIGFSTLIIDEAYSDSINDLPLLVMATKAFVVNPDKRLQSIAEVCGWKELEWQV